MVSMWTVLLLVHLVGLALGLGAASVKLMLLLRSRADHGFVPTFLEITRPVTRLIILGLILLTVSGIGWLLLGYPFTTVLIAKLVLVVGIWILGPVIDNVVEPELVRLAPAVGEPPSHDFISIQRRYLALEVAATGAFYVVLVMWVLV
jgi:hypothetical protein